MKILLIGKTGQLGADILRSNISHDIYAPDREILDISSRNTIDAVVDKVRPNIIINTAAFHNVPLCEIDPVSAFSINCVAVRDLAVASNRIGALFITFSSDYVFGGEKKSPYHEDDKPSPLQIYGMSRLVGEYAALSKAPDRAIVIRTCGLYGMSGASSKGGNFVDKRIQDAKKNTIVEMGCDQIVVPTYTKDLSEAVLQLIEYPHVKAGVYHLVNEGECTWYEFTKAIYDILGLNIQLKAVDRGGLSGEMRRPSYSVLANLKAKKLGITLPHWRDALKRYLKVKHM